MQTLNLVVRLTGRKSNSKQRLSAWGGGLFAHRFQDDAFRPAAVPFAVEDSLPGTEIEPAGGHGNNHLVAHGQRSQVGSGVVFAGSGVVAIPVGVPWSDVFLQPIENVLPEAGLVIVDEHGGGDVHRGDEHHAVVEM